MLKKLFSLPLLTLLGFFICGACQQARAETVEFLGVLDSGRAGSVLGSLPRNFYLSLDYDPDPTGKSDVAGEIRFASTPNGRVANPVDHPAVTAALIGDISIRNDVSGTDFFAFDGHIGTGLIGPNPVNFSFTFTKPDTTIANRELNHVNVGHLIAGQTDVFFTGGANGPSAQGVIRPAPEPATTVVLVAMALCGCGIGLRRRNASNH